MKLTVSQREQNKGNGRHVEVHHVIILPARGSKEVGYERIPQ